MRKTFTALAIVAAALSLPAIAQATRYHHHHRAVHHATPALAAGAAAGTVAALGTYNGWWGTSAFARSLPATAVGSAAVGGVVGVGTVAMIDAAVQPCRGLHALFDLNHGACANGEYVGYNAPPPMRRYR